MIKQKIASVLMAGAFFFVESGVVIDGIDVGGMKKSEAERLLRRSVPTLWIGEERFSGNEIGVEDNLFDLVRMGKGSYAQKSRFFLNGEADVVERIASNYHELPLDASVVFSENGFSYTPERSGRKVDKKLLVKRIDEVLNGGGGRVEVPLKEEKAKVTREELVERTRLLATFETEFDPKEEGRTKNIRLATKRLDGRTIESGEVFSFNEIVGMRTKENGFESAVVISNGVYTEGVGGGVCQVSTTLYNAALLTGLTILEARAHTLAVSYVLPSFDAMVSEYSDLKFQNEKAEAVYLSAKVEENKVRISFFGKEDGKTYERISRVKSVIEPPKTKIVEGDWDEVLRFPKKGMVAESYLDVYERGKLVSRKRLRLDRYEPIQGIEQKVLKTSCQNSDDMV